MASIIHISIIVEKGDPLDYAQYRHTSLWFQRPGGSPPWTMDIVGHSGGYEFDCRIGDQIREIRNFARKVDVGSLAISKRLQQVETILMRVPINNQDRGFNCQIRVQMALQRLVEHGWLSSEQHEKGVEGMVDAIAEAEDSEE